MTVFVCLFFLQTETPLFLLVVSGAVSERHAQLAFVNADKEASMHA